MRRAVLLLPMCLLAANMPPPQVVIPSQSLPNGVVGSSFSAQLTVSGGKAPYKWFLAQGTVSSAGPSTGTLPQGLSLGVDNGAITGTPTAIGTSTFNVVVSDATGSASPPTTLSI